MAKLYGSLPKEFVSKVSKAPELDVVSLFQGQGEKEKGLMLYIHVPFCRSRCTYCSFHSQIFNEVTFAWYIKLLLQEIALWGQRLRKPSISSIYFGGGTPSLIPLPQLRKIMEAIAQHFEFASHMEITLEANPDSAQDEHWFRGLLALGINRLSLGVQSLTNATLRTLGRPHNAQMAIEAFHMARSAGFANISLDFIWGLPGQGLKIWLDQLKVVARLGAEHLSCYALSLENNTVLHTRSLETDLCFASEQDQGKMFIYGAEFLESVGYLQYEISNFARMGFESKHNSGYWQGKNYLGLGPSAVTTIGDRRFRNPLHMDEYEARVRGNLSSVAYEVLDKNTKLTEMVMLSLRTSQGLNLKEYRKRSGVSLISTHKKFVQALMSNGLAKINREHLRLSKQGMLVSNVIMERMALTEQARDHGK